MDVQKVNFAVKLKKDEKEPEKKQEKPAEKKLPEKKPAEKKVEAEKFDLITIVDTVEMAIPEKEPPYNEILYDFIPESEQRVTANRDDHVSKKAD
jgi:hypothetical protein